MFDAGFEFSEKADGKPRAWFKVWVPANYQPKDAEKERGDGLSFEAWDDVATYCGDLKENDQVVVIARAGSYSTKGDDGKNKYHMKLIAERVWKVEATS